MNGDLLTGKKRLGLLIAAVLAATLLNSVLLFLRSYPLLLPLGLLGWSVATGLPGVLLWMGFRVKWLFTILMGLKSLYGFYVSAIWFNGSALAGYGSMIYALGLLAAALYIHFDEYIFLYINQPRKR